MKNSKCAISNKHIQNGRPSRYKKRERIKKSARKQSKKEKAREKMPEEREESQKREKQYRRAENLFNLDVVQSLQKDDQTRRVMPEQK